MCPSIIPDFSEVVELTAGEYPVRVTKGELKTTKNGDPMINWELTTFGKDDERLNNKKVFHNTMVTGKGAGILKQFLKAADYDLSSEGFDTDDLLGKELVAVLGPDKENPEMMRVKSVKKIKANEAAA
jgi:hypothetical protein